MRRMKEPARRLPLPHLRLVLPVSKTLRKLRWVGRGGRARREVRNSLCPSWEETPKRMALQAGFEPATLRLTEAALTIH